MKQSTWACPVLGIAGGIFLLNHGFGLLGQDHIVEGFQHRDFAHLYLKHRLGLGVDQVADAEGGRTQQGSIVKQQHRNGEHPEHIGQGGKMPRSMASFTQPTAKKRKGSDQDDGSKLVDAQVEPAAGGKDILPAGIPGLLHRFQLLHAVVDDADPACDLGGGNA
jgi:hypothetical protein